MTVYAIFGTGGHGRVVLENMRSSECVFLDDNKPIGTRINGAHVVGDRSLLSYRPFLAAHLIIIGIGDCKIRGELSRLVIKNGGHLAKSIHPTAIIRSNVEIGDGTVIMPYAIVGPNTKVGKYCIINNAAIVSHDCILGNGVNVADGATFESEVGDEAFIGLRAVTIPKIKIGARAIVGAGSVVTKDVPPDTTVAGVPAKIIRHKGTHS